MLLANYPCKRLLEDCEGWVCVSASIGGVQVVHYAPDYLLDGRAAYTWQKQLKFHLCSLQFSTNKKINTVNKWKFDLPGAGVNGMTLLTRKFLLLQGQSATGKYVWDSNMKIWESNFFAGDSTTAATLGAATAAILGATTATQRQYYAATHGQGGGRGGIPLSEGKKPTPYPKAESWLPSKKIFYSPPPLRQKIRHFWQSSTKKVPKWGKKGAFFLCVVLNCGENFLSPPPFPPSVTPNFTPPLEAFWGYFTFWGILSPSGKKSVPMCVCSNKIWDNITRTE